MVQSIVVIAQTLRTMSHTATVSSKPLKTALILKFAFSSGFSVGFREEYMPKAFREYYEETLKTSRSYSGDTWADVRRNSAKDDNVNCNKLGKTKSRKHRRRRRPAFRLESTDQKSEIVQSCTPVGVSYDGLSIKSSSGRSERAIQCCSMERLNSEVEEAGEEGVTEKLVIGRLSVIFTSSVRLLPKSVESIYSFSNDETTEPKWTPTYAQIVKTPTDFVSKSSWRREFNRYNGILTSALEKWKRQRRIFSIILKCEAEYSNTTENDDEVDPFTEKELALLKRLKKKMADFFGQTNVIDEIILREDCSKYRLLYIIPTKSAVERIMKETVKSDEVVIHTNRDNQINVVANEHENKTWLNLAKEISCISFEEKYWKKQEYNVKRKWGKANRKRLRAPIANGYATSKREISTMKLGSVAPKSAENPRDIHKKREGELTERKAQRRRQNSIQCFSCIDLTCQKLPPSNEEELGARVSSKTKRIELMQTKVRTLSKKLEREQRRLER